MDIMGHSSLSTTQIYTHIQKPHLRETIDNHFPMMEKNIYANSG
jgi:site-specific recombinase XerD